MTLSLTSLGGAGGVTGSKHLLEDGEHRILVDCGLFQGVKHLRERNWQPFPINANGIDSVVLTHAHIDHSGYLPKLVREGYQNKVLCSSATADLCKILLLDSAYIQEKDAQYANKHGFSKHRPALPLYDAKDAERALQQFATIKFNADTELPGGSRLKLRRAGHILGAAIAEVSWGSRTIVFSGDLGRYDDAVMLDPEVAPAADYVIVESTYGDRLHEKVDPAAALAEVIERTTRRGGTVIIPAFAVGRTQCLLYHLWRLKEAGQLRSTPIYLDSPMAINATELLCRHLDDHRLPTEACVDSCAVATYVRETAESKALSANPMPKVIISASGMATGGRVLHHLKAFGGDSRNTILFAGFQAAGTRGEALVGGARETKIHGQWIPIRAEVASLPMLSAHADAGEIIRWLGGFKRAPKRTFIVHGEPSASEALRLRIGRELGWECAVVEMQRAYELD